MNTAPISDDELHAYVDGQLPASRRTEVAAYLATDAEAAARVEAYAEQKRGIRQLYDAVADEPVPERLLRAARGGRAASAWLYNAPLKALAAGIAVFAFGIASGWFARDAFHDSALRSADLRATTLARQAAIAHAVYSPDVRRPVEVGAEQEEQLVAWLSKRLGTPVRAPKLGGIGYELIGGRLLPGNSGPVAQFMYQDAGGQRLTLYVSNENPTGAGTGFRFAREGAVNVFYWIDGGFGYALSADIDKGELARAASVVYGQLAD